MTQRDFYHVLGVPKSASADEIRKAYRSLARQLHPDVNKAADAQKKFTEVQHAYDVLGDEQKRKLYDRYGHAAFEAGAVPPNGQGRHQGRHGHEATGHMPRDLDPEELSDIFETFFGGGGGPFGGTGGRGTKGRTPRARPDAPPAEHRHELLVSFNTIVKGGSESVRIGEGSHARSVEVKIPRGVEDGTQLRLRGVVGNKRSAEDLILIIRTGSHPLFRRGEFTESGKGLDLFLDLPLTIAEAAIGGTIAIPTPSGTVELNIPAGSSSGRKMRLKARGLRDEHGREGDLYAVLKVVGPSGHLSDEEKSVLREISARGAQPRSGPEWRT